MRGRRGSNRGRAGRAPVRGEALRRFFDRLGDVPGSLAITSPDGGRFRRRALAWNTLESLGTDPSVGSIDSIDLRSQPLPPDAPSGQASFEMSLYLRHNPALRADEQPPAALWMAVTSRSTAYVAVPEAARELVTQCAQCIPLLHGGITALDNLAQAASEVTGTATDVRKQPELFQRRREHDWWMNQDLIRTRCRRLYSTTLLGPALAQAAGGAEAARAAGAIDVREVNGSLIFRAMEGPPRDSLDPAFLAATVGLRRWLWPHTFQNPLDAAGFEAEVGLPVG
jgi:hypothetical protein